MTMLGGSALAQYDDNDLLGTWDARIEGSDGAATVRIVFTAQGQYLALAQVEGADEPVPFWQVGEWDLDDDVIAFDVLRSSESIGETEEHSEVTITTLTASEFRGTAEDDPMWGQLAFERVLPGPLVGRWEGEGRDGEMTFCMACGGAGAGAFSASLDDGGGDVVWGHWTQRGDSITFELTETEWDELGDDAPEFEEARAHVEDFDDETMVLQIDDLGDEPIEFERVAGDPFVGEWQARMEDVRFDLAIEDGGTFAFEMRGDGEREGFEGIWTNLGDGMLFFVPIGADDEPKAMRVLFTSPHTLMIGEEFDDMLAFERR
ncbi:MAG: hypothetical protein KDA05_05620 [Phycisphaerales bacterium]|nr:hypothetical protein [Phycisphaerales bacterium]